MQPPKDKVEQSTLENVPLRPIDLKLIKLLMANPRSSISELARNLKTSRMTVRKRIRVLHEGGWIRFQVTVNSTLFKYRHSLLYLQAEDPRQTTQIAEALSQCPRVLSIMLHLKNFNLIVHLVACDTQLLSRVVEGIQYLFQIKEYYLIPVDSSSFYNLEFFPIHADLIEHKTCCLSNDECDTCNCGVCSSCPVSQAYEKAKST